MLSGFQLDGSSRHAEYHTSLLALSHGLATTLAQGEEAFGTVTAHASEQNTCFGPRPMFGSAAE